MAEATYSWPENHKSRLIGKRVNRLDGMEKSSGTAKYTYDVNLPKQLIVHALGCPHAHCNVISVDTTAAEKVPGVALVHLIKAPASGDSPVEVRAQGTLLAAVAAETEAAAAEGVSKLDVKYEVLEAFVEDDNLEGAEAKKRTKRSGGGIELDEDLGEPGDDDDEEEWEEAQLQKLFDNAKYVVEGNYGISAITHCCLEPHGATLHWEGDRLKVYLSTQNVSQTDDGFAGALDLTADDVDVTCDYIGGGFGSKFQPNYWGIAAAEIAKKTGRPVKFMLSRDQELKIAGNRPSGFTIEVKLGADEDGVVQGLGFPSLGYRTGFNGSTVSRLVRFPYVFRPKNWRRKATGIRTNNEASVAWRAPNHPQACALTSQTAFDDLAAARWVPTVWTSFIRNLRQYRHARKGQRVCRTVANRCRPAIDWRRHWHPHGKGEKRGSVVEGLGIAIHKWAGEPPTIRTAC